MSATWLKERSLQPRVAIAAAVAMVAIILLVFQETALGVFRIWMRSDTFNHCLLVAPVSIWLMWERRRDLVSAGFRPALFPLLPLAGAALLWVFGEAISAAVVSHAALVFMVIAAIWTCWGHRASWQVLFPLFFLVFGIPFGDFLVPMLMHYTAEFTVALLRLTGIPVYQEGQNFVIPSGRWSVVEACSGIRYLIASMMVGVLFAYLNYRSLTRRLLFVVASFVVPLLANWLRAYIIVMMGHLSGNSLAVGADHLIYGWVFFGIVIGLLFWVGSFWREDHLPQVRQRDWSWRSPGRVVLPATAVLGLALLTVAVPRPLLAWLMDVPGAADYRVPAVTVPGWSPAARTDSEWKAHFLGARVDDVQSFTKGRDKVSVQLAYYARQTEGRELVQYDNYLVQTDDPLWHPMNRKTMTLAQGERTLTFERVELTGAGGHIVVLRSYWLGESVTPSDKLAKLDLLKARLLRRPDDSAGVLLWTSVDNSAADAEQKLVAFANENWSAIEAALLRTPVK
ncbi:exosortase A [Viridibacterium curvum]|uniref:Exosortase A n=1 Tax=Viridibacterium curvum TaxID=1101404 RepID=A0ABP9QEL8_9RHOO